MTSPPPRRPGTLLGLLALALAAGLTAAVIHESQLRGRLARTPRVDDVIYLARAAELLDAWRHGGAEGLVRDYAAAPPHSPYASGIAALGFGLTGHAPWSPYALAGVATGLFLLAAARLARTSGPAGAGRAKRWAAAAQAGALVGWAAMAPLLAASVHNLKPDYACGMAAAVGMLVLLRRPLGPARRAALAGAAFGLALLIKPAMGLPTGLLMVGTLGVCGLRDAAVAGWTVWKRAAAGAAATVIVAMATALPHYALAWGQTKTYVAGVLGGDGRALWGYRGSPWDHAAYYLTGPGGRLMLDGWRTLGPCLLLVGGAGARVALRGTRRDRAYALACGAALGAAYLGPTMSPVKIAQFAAPLQALLVLMAVQSGTWLLQTHRRGTRPGRRGGVPWASMLVIAAVAWRGASYRWTFPRLPASPTDPVRKLEDDRTALADRVWAAVRGESARAAPGPGRAARVLVTGGPGTIDEPLLVLWAAREGVRIETRAARNVPGSDGGQGTLAWADVVIANEGDTGLTVAKRTAPGSDGAWLAAARADAGLRRVLSELAPGTDRRVEVYTRIMGRPAEPSEPETTPEPRPSESED